MGSLFGALPPCRRPQVRVVGSRAALLFAGIATAGSLVVSGCGGAGAAKPVATVNSQSLSEKEFQSLCENATEVQPQQATVGLQVLMQWMRNAIMTEEARRSNVYPSDKELETRLTAVRNQYSFTGQSLEDMLRRQGMTMEAFRRSILNDLVSENVICKGVTISDDEVRKRFEQEQQNYVIPEQRKIAQITLDSEEKMKQAKNDLGANAQFQLVASTYSRDQFAQGGGAVPFPVSKQMPAGGPVAPEAAAAAFKLKPGQVSDPVKVGSSWVIVRLDEIIPEKKPRFEDIADLIKSAMRREKAQTPQRAQELQKTIIDIANTAKIQVNRPEYQSIVAQMKATSAAQPGLPAGPADGHEGHGHDGQPHPGTPPPPPGG